MYKLLTDCWGFYSKAIFRGNSVWTCSIWLLNFRLKIPIFKGLGLTSAPTHDCKNAAVCEKMNKMSLFLLHLLPVSLRNENDHCDFCVSTSQGMRKLAIQLKEFECNAWKSEQWRIQMGFLGCMWTPAPPHPNHHLVVIKFCEINF